MKIEDLDSLYRDELKDAYDFEHQILDALPKMAKKATHPQLRKAFEQHRAQTRTQVERLEQVFRDLGDKPERKTCKGMKGLLAEGKEVLEAKGDAAAIDAALVGAAQRVEHYEMAAYGTLRAFAETLGRSRQARLLKQTLDEESRTDEKLSQMAEKQVNPKAAEGRKLDGGSARASRSTTRGAGAARKRAAKTTASRRRGAAGNSASPGDSTADGPTKDELYEKAKRLDVDGRSSMNKKQLSRAVARKS